MADVLFGRIAPLPQQPLVQDPAEVVARLQAENSFLRAKLDARDHELRAMALQAALSSHTEFAHQTPDDTIEEANLYLKFLMNT